MPSTETISLKSIQEARNRIGTFVKTTPLMRSIFLESLTKMNVFLKLENLNTSGSFKIRGATNCLLKLDEQSKKNGVVATSAGNHAQGVARTAHHLKLPATIFMPKNAPLVKAESTRNLGANVVLTGETYDDAENAAKEWQARNNAYMIHPFADPEVICGQGTVGLEVLQQLDQFDVILVPVGGGGLISGLACAVKSIRPEVHIIGVQSEAYPNMANAFNNQKSRVSPLKAKSSIADGIAVKNVNEFTLKLINTYVDEMIYVSEDSIAAAIMYLMERDHLLAEGAGAAGIAALLDDSTGIQKKFAGKTCVCILSGGNIDVNLLSKITTRGLIFSGRLMRIRLNLADQPGALANLLNEIGKLGANLQNVHHNRTFGSASYKEVELDVDLETINISHQQDIQLALSKQGLQFHVLWHGHEPTD